MQGIAGPGRKYLFLSVDTEPDDPAWLGLGRGPWMHENLKGLGELQRRLNILGVRPTYLITHSVAEHGGLEKTLGRDLAEGACEVGAHFHPGDTPPFAKTAKATDDNILRVPADLLEAKFSALHGLIAARFGTPASHRAAAWALDARLSALLVKYGYRVDSSVTPGISWKRIGRPSYLSAPMHAYELGTGDPCRPGKSGILEVPVSIWSPRRWAGTLAGALVGDLLTMPMAARVGWAARALNAIRPGRPQWLRPAFKEAESMIRVAAKLEDEGAEYLHVMCHSNELWPGTSPYCRNRGDLDRFYVRLEGLLTMARERGYRPMTLSGYASLVFDVPGYRVG